MAPTSTGRNAVALSEEANLTETIRIHTECTTNIPKLGFFDENSEPMDPPPQKLRSDILGGLNLVFCLFPVSKGVKRLQFFFVRD